MTGPRRLAAGGRIDRSRPLRFVFDGRSYQGFVGDTLASALLAAGTVLFARSFKYHRPRGVMTAGPEEPNALVSVIEDGHRTPNLAATMVELRDGLVAESQNRWPSLRFDALAAVRLAAPLLPAGFYYKTFKWPRAFWEPVYEKLIRRAAGLGAMALEADSDRYEETHDFPDVLVIGGGATGLAAARAAGECGARVLLVDENPSLGGRLRRKAVPGEASGDRIGSMEADLAALPAATCLTRTTVFGQYDSNVFGLCERLPHDSGGSGSGHNNSDSAVLRQRYRIARARSVVFATGSIEQPLVFPNNDLPGVMLASAARSYCNQYGVAAGGRAVVATCGDEAYETAAEMAEAGIEVAALAELRETPPATADRLREMGIPVLAGADVLGAGGFGRLRHVDLRTPDGRRHRIRCDLLCVSGGEAPTLHLTAQAGSRPVFDAQQGGFSPGPLEAEGQFLAGTLAGAVSLQDRIASGEAAGRDAACFAGFSPGENAGGGAGEGAGEGMAAEPSLFDGILSPDSVSTPVPMDPTSLGAAPMSAAGAARSFVDLQNDVTVRDIALAQREGYESVEHAKRYTMLGMGTEQGKLSNIAGIDILAAARGIGPGTVGTTSYRPPYTPVAMGAITAFNTGRDFMPERLSPMHGWHERRGSVMTEAGAWMRPEYYPRPGETAEKAWRREAAHVRRSVGLADVSTLGKIDVQGPDAAEFLERVFANRCAALAPGRVRYGVMLREDGFVLDDGTISRLVEDHFFLTTTTAHTGHVLLHMEFLLQTAWPELRVHLTDTTDCWAAFAVAGPESRALLSRAVDGIDFTADAFPRMHIRKGRIDDVRVRVLRASYSGALAYEIYAPADCGERVWEHVLVCAEGPDAEGSDAEKLDVDVYGTEAMGILRIERGHVAGPEIDGRTTLADLNLAGLARKDRPFVGSVLMRRPALIDPGRPSLVGLSVVDAADRLAAGSLVREHPFEKPDGDMLGHVSSVTWSPALGRDIALALVEGGVSRIGTTLYACHTVKEKNVAVRVSDPVFVPEVEG